MLGCASPRPGSPTRTQSPCTEKSTTAGLFKAFPPALDACTYMPFFNGSAHMCIFCYFIFSLTMYHEHISMSAHVRIPHSFIRLPWGPGRFWDCFLILIHGNNEAINVYLSVLGINLIWEKMLKWRSPLPSSKKF